MIIFIMMIHQQLTRDSNWTNMVIIDIVLEMYIKIIEEVTL